MPLDATDREIIAELEKDSRLSSASLSKRTGIPQTTIHYRIRKLLTDKVIAKYTILLNHEKIGRPVMAYVLVQFDTNKMAEKKLTYEELAKGIRGIAGVEEFAYTTGQYDIVLRVTAESMKALSKVVLEKLRNIPGVSRTESFIVMDYFGK